MNIPVRSMFRFLSIFLTFCITPQALAQPFIEYIDAQPVSLTDRKSSLQNRMQFPNIAGAVYVRLLCNGMVDENGRFYTQVTCIPDRRVDQRFTPKEAISRPSRIIDVGADVEVTTVTTTSLLWLEERFEREVVEASRRSKLEPARYEGRKVVANVNFSVVFEQTSDEKNIEVYLHHFHNEAALGSDYIAAQGVGYKVKATDTGRPVICPEFFNPLLIRSSVHLDGTVNNVAVEEVIERNRMDIDSYEACLPAYVELVENTLFIPAYADGEFVTTYHVSVFYDQIYEEHAEDDAMQQDETLDFRDLMNGGGGLRKIRSLRR